MQLGSVLILSLIVVALAQQQDQQVPNGQQVPETEQDYPDGSPNVNMTQEQFIETTRNVFYSCIVISRNYLNIGEGVVKHLREIADAYQQIDNEEAHRAEQLKVWKRIYIDHVKHCANLQTPQGANQIYKDLYQGKFDPRVYFYLVGDKNLNEYKGRNVVTVFDQDEEMLWGMMEDFEKKIKEQQDDDDEAQVRYDDKNFDYTDYEPKLFGVSMKSESKIMEAALLLGVFGMFGLVLFAGYKVLTKEEPQKDKKKSKKAKKNQE